MCVMESLSTLKDCLPEFATLSEEKNRFWEKYCCADLFIRNNIIYFVVDSMR